MCMIYMYLHLNENMSFLVWEYKALASRLHASPINSVRLPCIGVAGGLGMELVCSV